MLQKVKFILGSDPELFIRCAKTKQLRSAIPIIPEGKGQGRPLGKGNFVLHDNVLIEVNTKPAKTIKQFVQTIGTVLKDVSKVVKPQGLELHLQASANFPVTELKLAEAREFGCDPDFGVYPQPMLNSVPPGAATKPFRSAGGHLHIGVHNAEPSARQLLEDDYGKIAVVKALDIFVGLIGSFIDTDPTSSARRALYGKAGCHRPKPYGVEYRACSPWWLASPQHSELVYHLSQASLALALEKQVHAKLTAELGGEERICTVINEGKTEEARKLYQNHLKIFLSTKVNQLISQLSGATFDFQIAWGL